MMFFKFFRSRKTDPQTSHDAAEQAQELADKHFIKIHFVLAKYGPMGKDGIAQKTGLDSAQVSRRLPEMQKLGLVRLTGNFAMSFARRKEREWSIVEKKI
jgi:predicted transcriptional regulator